MRKAERLQADGLGLLLRFRHRKVRLHVQGAGAVTSVQKGLDRGASAPVHPQNNVSRTGQLAQNLTRMSLKTLNAKTILCRHQ